MNETSEWAFPNAATPPGSGPYYVVRFCAPERHHELAHWFAWFDHIDQIAAKASDPGVARLKLDWWQEESARMLDKEARHPLAQALAQQVTAQSQVEQMQRALKSTEERILRRQPRTLEEFLQQCGNHSGSRLALLCGPEAEDAGAIEIMGRHVAATQRLNNLLSDLQDDYLSLPAQLLSSNELTGSEIEQASKPDALMQVAEQLLNAVGLDKNKLHALRRAPHMEPAVRQAAQSLRLARRLKKQHFDPRQVRQLTPIGLLWSAWRMR